MSTKTNSTPVSENEPSKLIKARVFATRLIIRLVILAILVVALYVSYLDIRKTGTTMEMLPWQAMILPIFIDGVALAGRLSMALTWDEATRKRGKMFMIGGGLVSFACNVFAGDTLGQRVFGGAVVVVAVLLEAHLSNMISLAITKSGAPRKQRTAEQQAAINAKAQATKAHKAAQRATSAPVTAPAPARRSRRLNSVPAAA